MFESGSSRAQFCFTKSKLQTKFLVFCLENPFQVLKNYYAHTAIQKITEQALKQQAF